MVQIKKQWKMSLAFGLALTALSARAETVVLEATGTAEATPDLYVYALNVEAGCQKSEDAATDKVAALEGSIGELVKKYASADLKIEDQFYQTSNDLPEQNLEDISAYVRGNFQEQKVICSAGNYSYTASYVFKLLDVKKRAEFQRELVKTIKANTIANPELVLNKETFGIKNAGTTPRLKTETQKALFDAAYKDALESAIAKYRSIRASAYRKLGNDETATQHYVTTWLTDAALTGQLTQVSEKRDQNGRPIYAFASAAMDAPGGAPATPGTQKLKLEADYVFTFYKQ